MSNRQKEAEFISPSEVSLEIGITLAEANRRLILATLRACVGDKKRAAALLGVSVKTLYNRLRAYGIEGPERATFAPFTLGAGVASVTAGSRTAQRTARRSPARPSTRRERPRPL